MSVRSANTKIPINFRSLGTKSFFQQVSTVLSLSNCFTYVHHNSHATSAAERPLEVKQEPQCIHQQPARNPVTFDDRVHGAGPLPRSRIEISQKTGFNRNKNSNHDRQTPTHGQYQNRDRFGTFKQRTAQDNLSTEAVALARYERRTGAGDVQPSSGWHDRQPTGFNRNNNSNHDRQTPTDGQHQNRDRFGTVKQRTAHDNLSTAAVALDRYERRSGAGNVQPSSRWHDRQPTGFSRVERYETTDQPRTFEGRGHLHERPPGVSKKPLFYQRLNRLLLDRRSRVGDRFVYDDLAAVVADAEVLEHSYRLVQLNTNEPKDLPEEWFKRTAEKLAHGEYTFRTVTRNFFPRAKRSNERRYVEVADFEDNVVHAALNTVLTAAYEPIFLDVSHGGRLTRSPHTALQNIKANFQLTPWVISGQWEELQDTLSHELLIKRLSHNVADRKLRGLVKSCLKRPILEVRKSSKNTVQATQGVIGASTLFPFFCNLVLHPLDEFATQLAEDFRQGDTIPADFGTSDFRRMYFVRYLNSFVVGVIGPKSDALNTKQKVRDFCSTSLQMEPNHLEMEHMSKGFDFLDTFIFRERRSLDQPRPILEMHIPTLQILRKMRQKGYIVGSPKGRNGTHEGASYGPLVSFAHASTLRYFNNRVKALADYYSFADNKRAMLRIAFMFKQCVACTFANKYKLKSQKKVYKAYGPLLTDPETGVQFLMPKGFVSQPKSFNLHGSVPSVDDIINKPSKSLLKPMKKFPDFFVLQAGTPAKRLPA